MIDIYNILKSDKIKLLMEIEGEFLKNSFEIKIVGGFVRDAILNIANNETDIDLSTTANPSEVRKICKNLHFIEVLDVGGGEFGTLILFDKKSGEKFEITSCRLDMKTFGRAAEVSFCKSFTEDSRRRDFTVNGLYMNLNGDILDFHNGISDLKNKKIRFIGDAKTRIQEDFLRIIRYFRFAAIFGDFDEEIFKVCKEMAINLDKISINRFIWEFLKMFRNKSYQIVLKMKNCDIFSSIGIDFNEVLFKKIDDLDKEKLLFFDIKPEFLRLAVLFYSDKNKHFVEKSFTREQKNIIKVAKNQYGSDVCEVLARTQNIKNAAINIIFNFDDIERELKKLQFLSQVIPPKVNIHELSGLDIKEKIYRENLKFYQERLHQGSPS